MLLSPDKSGIEYLTSILVKDGSKLFLYDNKIGYYVQVASDSRIRKMNRSVVHQSVIKKEGNM